MVSTSFPARKAENGRKKEHLRCRRCHSPPAAYEATFAGFAGVGHRVQANLALQDPGASPRAPGFESRLCDRPSGQPLRPRSLGEIKNETPAPPPPPPRRDGSTRRNRSRPSYLELGMGTPCMRQAPNHPALLSLRLPRASRRRSASVRPPQFRPKLLRYVCRPRVFPSLHPIFHALCDASCPPLYPFPCALCQDVCRHQGSNTCTGCSCSARIRHLASAGSSIACMQASSSRSRCPFGFGPGARRELFGAAEVARCASSLCLRTPLATPSFPGQTCAARQLQSPRACLSLSRCGRKVMHPVSRSLHSTSMPTIPRNCCCRYPSAHIFRQGGHPGRRWPSYLVLHRGPVD